MLSLSGLGLPGRIPFFAAILAFACVLHSPHALAEGRDLIVILEPAPPRSPETEETFTRLEAELRASGFDVKVEVLDATETRQALEDAVTRSDAAAAITIRDPEASSGQPEVWVRDRLTGKLVVRKDDGPAGSPRLVAIHAVELLRASLIELRDPPPSKKDGTPTPLPDPVSALLGPEPKASARPASSGWAGFGVELGGGTIVHFDPALPMVVPALRLSYVSALGVGARLVLVGPGLGPDLADEASVSEVLATAEFLYAPSLPWPFEFAASAGVGVYRVGASSEIAPDPAPGGSYVSALFTLGAASGVRLTDHFALDLNLLLGVAAPRVAVESGARVLATLGRPLFGATAGVRASF